MVSREFFCPTEADTEAQGRDLASKLSRDDVVYLLGELGAGKTTFARGLAVGLGAIAREVASPTFALLHEYANPAGAVVLRHLDLYRLPDDPRELERIGLPESVSGTPVCIEWPRRAVRRLLPPSLEVTLEALPDQSRRVRVSTAARTGS